jgi:hypothetical protein
MAKGVRGTSGVRPHVFVTAGLRRKAPNTLTVMTTASDPISLKRRSSAVLQTWKFTVQRTDGLSKRKAVLGVQALR